MASQREFNGITREKLDRLRQNLGKWGIEIPDGDDVEVKGPFGVRMRASYEEPRELLRLSITEKPIFVSEKQIWKVVENGAERFG